MTDMSDDKRRRLASLRAKRAPTATGQSIELADRDVPFATSFQQQRLWFLHELSANSTAYNITVARRIHGPLDVDALRGAFDDLIDRHEALQTVFIAPDGVPIQVIRRPAPTELVAEPGDVAAIVAAEARHVFDLARGPLLRTRLVRSAPDDHTLIVTLHHIVTDGWSMDVLWRDLAAFYDARVRGIAADVPLLRVQYVDYAAWQRTRIAGPELERLIAYWTARLAGLPDQIELPLKGPRPPVQTDRGDRLELAMPADLVAELRAFARAHSATVFMTVLAAIRTVLARYVGHTDFAIGTPVSNRDRRDLEGLIGFFVNTVAVRTPLVAGDTFETLLEREKNEVITAQDHHEAPFEQVVNALGISRNLSVTPVFQVSYAHQGEATATQPFGPAATIERAERAPTVPFDLTFETWDEGDGLALHIFYNADLFDRIIVEQLARHVVEMLAQVLRAPNAPLATLPLVTGDELARIVRCESRPALPARLLAPVQIAAQVARAPHAVAITSHGRTVTYADLDARANRLAHSLKQRGVGPDVPVVLAMPRGDDIIVAMVAVWKAGGCFVPIDPLTPAERRDWIAQNCGTPVVLTAGDVDVAGPDTPVETPAHDEQLAYLIYTSGSTGRPKGVAVSHGALATFIANVRADYGITPASSTSQIAALSFDGSLTEVWPYLCTGASIHVIPDDLRADPVQLIGWLRQARVTHAFLPTVLCEAVLDSPRSEELELDLIYAGGDRLTRRPRPGHRFRLANAYGPTETAVIATLATITGDDARPPGIGTPWPGYRVYVLDGELARQPFGVAGELYIAGDGVARGYIARPDLTAERFLPDPFGPPGARMYRTGDLARRRVDGELEYIGRADFQVKVRGFRIELEEIEAALLAHPRIHAACVVVREDAARGKFLVAYVGGEAAPGELRSLLAARLPPYMVPSAFVVLERLPLNAHGKVDRPALPPVTGEAIVARDYTAPRTPDEDAITAIWRAVLGLPRIGVRDNFFELGGHSLLVTRVLTQIRDQLGADISLRTFFAEPTIEALARHVASGRDRTRTFTIPLVADVRDARPPLSYAQRRLWFLQQLHPDSTAYNVPAPRRLRGPLDVAALERALTDLVARHESLRTVFPATDGEPYQQIQAATAWTLPVEDLGTRDLERLVLDDGFSPFDLATGPLVRARLIRIAPDDHALLITMHHIVTDGWSMEVLWQELGTLYAAHRQGTPSTLAPLPLQYADFAAWQRSTLSGDALERVLAYWTEQLRGAPEDTPLPFKGPRPPRQTFNGAHARFEIEAELSARLRRVAKTESATLFMTLLAGLRALLARYSGQADLSIGTPVANRNQAEIERLIGFFVGTLVLRNDVRPDESFAGLLAREKACALAAYDHQEAPFEMIVDALGVERTLSRPALFQVMLSHEGVNEPTLDVGGLRATRLLTGTTAKFDLTVTTWEVGDTIAGVFTYNTDLFDPELVEQMARHFVRLLDVLTRDPALPVGRATILDATEEQAMLVGWNATEWPLESVSVTELLQRQAARTPAATAVESGAERLSYAELHARAHQVAHHLLAQGLRPPTPVGVLVERSLDLVVALLAILEVGAPYLAIDPKDPRERAREICADAQIGILITTRASAVSLGPIAGVRVLEIDTEAREIAARPASPVGIEISPDALAYLLYTSGSTGKPKGVMVTHRGLANFLRWSQAAHPLDASDAVIQKTTPSFDASVWELWAPLTAGARLVLAPPGNLDPRMLVETITTHGVTTLKLVPSLLAALLQEPGFATSPLVRVFSGGEALPLEVANDLRRRTRIALTNMYGPTEITIDASAWSCAPTPDERPVPIGTPLANMRLYVLDRQMLPVPVGVLGELYIGGVQLARGYLGRPDLTAERFVPDPFGPPGSRLYRSGDLVRYRRDGAIEYLGRLDHQIKLRGFRIELDEIANVLRTHPLVRAAAVLAVDDARRGTILVAYACPTDGHLDTAVLREYLTARLPHYMIPSAFVELAELPLTPSGKLDRKRLPRLGDDDYEREQYVAPRSEAERVIAAIWSRLLGVEQVGVHDNFFSLGGHSLLVMRLIADIDRELGVRIPVSEVFEHPTVEALAAYVAAQPAKTTMTSAPLVYAPTGATHARATVPQCYFYYLDRDDHDPSSYFSSHVLVLEGPLDPARFAQAYRDTTHAHTIWRTAYHEIDGVLHTTVMPLADALPTEIDLVDRSGLPEDEWKPELARTVAELTSRGYDLARGRGMLHARLVRVADDRHLYVQAFHHIASDGGSGSAFMNALFAAYQGAASEPPLQYVDFAATRERWSTTPDGVANHELWRTIVDGAEPLVLEGDFPRAALDAHRDRVPFGISATLSHPPEVFRLPDDVYQAVVAAAQSVRGTNFAVFLGGLAWLLHGRSGQRDIVLQTAYSPRAQQAELARVCGCLTTWTVTRVNLANASTFLDAVRGARAAINAVHDNGAPYEFYQLVPHTMRRMVFNYIPAHPTSFGNPPQLQVRGYPWPFPPWKRPWDLHLTLIDDGASARLIWTGAQELFRRDTVLELLRQYVAILQG